MPKAVSARVCLLSIALAAFAAAGCNKIETRVRPVPQGPNVLLVTIDTLRADYVGATAKHATKTPTLDALAADGALFENASATVPLTLPSHTSILTGQYPPRHGVRHNTIHQLRPEKETIAERFQAAGYATGAFVSAAVLAREFGLDQGFDVYRDETSDQVSNTGGFAQVLASETSARALDWIAQTDRPFFAWVHYYDVHASYEPPEPFRTEFASDLYAGEVAYVDRELGRVFEALRKSGRWENTLVVVTADHGEGLGEHGELTHTYLIYESTMHVPLIVRGPGVPKGARIADVVSNAAIAPTLAELAKLGPLAEADVTSFAGLLRGEKPRDEFAYSESLAGYLDHGWAPIHAIRTRAEKYIRAPRAELFDLDADPGEQKNLLEPDPKAHPERVAHAEQSIEELVAREEKASQVAVDAETRAQIEALGYVVPSGGERKGAGVGDPKDLEKYSQLAFHSTYLTSIGAWAEAEQMTLEALKHMPTSATLHEAMARIFLGTGREPMAVVAAQNAIRFAPESPRAHGLLGEIRFKMGDYAGGVAEMEKALALDPNQAGAHFAMMWKLKLGASVEEVEVHAKRGLELGGNRPSSVEACGEAWEYAGEYDRAIATYQEGIRRATEPPDRLHMRLAIQYARYGEEEKAREELALAKDAVKDVRLATRLAIVYAAREEIDRAEPILRSLVPRDRTRTAPRVLARMLRTHGREAEANRISPPYAPPVQLQPILDGLTPGRAPRG